MRRQDTVLVVFVFAVVLVSFCQPVAAATIRNPDYIHEIIGTWNSVDKYAWEASYYFNKHLILWFEFNNVPQGRSSYYIRIDYDSYAVENMVVLYRWGDESVYPDPRFGGWTQIDTCGWSGPHDYWIKIASATDTTLQVCFQDTWPETSIPFVVSSITDGWTIWDFGREPQLKYY